MVYLISRYRFVVWFCPTRRLLLRWPFSMFQVVWLTLIFISFCTTNAVSDENCVSLDEKLSTYNLDGALSYYEDPASSLSLGEILDKGADSWSPLDGAVPNFGFSESVYWLKFVMCSPQGDGESLVLEVKYPLLDSITLFGLAGRNVVFEESTGDSIRFSERPVEHRNFIFYLPNSPTETLSFYLRVETESAVQAPLALYTGTKFAKHNQSSLLLQGLYFGIILAMMLYNGFLFFSLRELPYLLYVLFTISYFNFQGVFQGFFQQFVFDSIWWQSHALLIFGFTSILFANLFADSFLNLSRHNQRISRILRGIAVVAALSAPLASVLPYVHMVKMMLAIAIPSSLLIMFAGVKLWWVGHLPARIFTIAWSTLLVSFILASLGKFGLLPRSFWTENIMQLGGVLEVVLLSIALGERINEEKRHRILIEQNLATSLEEQVQERTLELNRALGELENTNTVLETEQDKLETALQEISGNHEELEQTYNELKSAQTQLLQVEKMQSVGRLAAGIAHEINTPIQYIGTNLEFLKESFRDSRELISEYNRIVENGGCTDNKLLKEIENTREDVDWDYLEEEIPQAIQQSQDGIQQISSIVLAMKDFSHPGSNEKEMADINQLIQTTVTVARNEWKNIAELNLDLADDISPVPCQPNEISQVILNMLINAAHAVVQQQQEGDTVEPGAISITTRTVGKFLQIIIADTGGGIPETIRHKIFDPFFTTKEVGKGTGQGLAIAQDIIVNKHGGKLEVEVEESHGTTFIILLPLKLEEQSATVEKKQENT